MFMLTTEHNKSCTKCVSRWLCHRGLDKCLAQRRYQSILSRGLNDNISASQQPCGTCEETLTGPMLQSDRDAVFFYCNTPSHHVDVNCRAKEREQSSPPPAKRCKSDAVAIYPSVKVHSGPEPVLGGENNVSGSLGHIGLLTVSLQVLQSRWAVLQLPSSPGR